MRQLIKYFLWIGCLALGLQTAGAFSLLGPLGVNGTTGGTLEDNWQVNEIGYNPLVTAAAPPFIGTQGQLSGPKNLGEGYRLNTPVLYYTFDPSFGYFGSNGEAAVEQTFDILNNLTNVDQYSTNLSEFPLNSESVNYQAQTLGLLDVKSATMSLMLGQMGLADAVRYTWCLLDRFIPPGATCPAVEYAVIMRNYNYYLTPFNQIQYSPYVNDALYNYSIYEDCDAPGASPPTADALEIAVDPLYNNPPVASGLGEDFLGDGRYYTGLTRDDVAGLRYLLSTNNVFAPGQGYLETPAGGSVVLSGGGGQTFTNFNDQFTLTTSNLTALVLASTTNNPATLQTLYPGLVITSVRTNTFSGTYTYTFGNVYTNTPFFTNTPVLVQVVTTNVGPYGAYYPPIIVTNVTTNTTLIQSNIVSGDFFLIPTNTCGLEILQVLATNLSSVTNTLPAVTNISGNSTNYITTNLVFVSTNYTLGVAPCESLISTGGTNANVGDYQGIGRVQFVRVSDDNYDYLTGQFYQPLTNDYSMVVMRGGVASTVSFERVVTRPDYVFQGEELAQGGGNVTFLIYSTYAETTPNFLDSRTAAGLAGPGIIDPTSGTNVAITLNTVGPAYENESPSFLNGPGSALGRTFIWGSFDGSTNAPVVYPNGTSIASLAAEALIQISPAPPTLPSGATTNAYNVTLTAGGGQPPYSWSLASNSPGLPNGLSLSPNGVISGTPTQTGTYDFVIQLTDSDVPTAHVVQIIYSVTIH